MRGLLIDDEKRAIFSFGMNMRNVKGSNGLGDEDKANKKSNKNRKLNGSIPVKTERVAKEVLVNKTEETKTEREKSNKYTNITKNN